MATGRVTGICVEVHSEPSGRRLEVECRSSNTTSDPSSRLASTAPHAVHPITAVASSSLSAQILARWATWFERRTCAEPWRETCTTSTPARSPWDTGTGPNGVSTLNVSATVKPGSESVPTR